MYGQERRGLDVALACNNRGIVYKSQGRYEEALGQHEKALEIRTRVFGSEHPDVAISYKNIGIGYHHQGNVVEATEMYTKAYRIYLKVRGPDHPRTLNLKPFVKLD